MIDRKGNVMQSFLTYDDKWRLKAEMHELSPIFKKVILLKEDRFFYYHFGFNPISILKASFKNITRGKRVSGASTITMQLVRLLEPRPRTILSKLIEVFRAMQLELKFSKTEIFQMYINLIPYGGNIEGIKSASLLYFNKNPNNLSLSEIVTLSIIPNRPNSLKPSQYNPELLKQRNKWLNWLKVNHYFSDKLITQAINEPLQIKRMPSPKLCPHLCRKLFQKNKSLPYIKTYINIEIQQRAEQITKNHISKFILNGISNASVMIVDNYTNEVITYIGSADFWNKKNLGEVDGIKAIRQPGSTLKPLLYGMAIDMGKLTPKTILEDIPTNFNGYTPENYDQIFRGYISADRALALSLNIPAVKVLEQVGLDHVKNQLIKCGFEQVKKEKSNLGLSIALGGCGATMDQMMGLYVAIANHGKWKPLKYEKHITYTDSQTLLSPETSYILKEILSASNRPDFPLSLQNTPNPGIAFKTGTSYGKKDFWCFGFNSRYTVGVWMGNFDGTSIPDFNGAEASAPLLFDIFKMLNQNQISNWGSSKPISLQFRYICSESGLLPSENCKAQILDYYLPQISSNKVCKKDISISCNTAQTISYCAHCKPSSNTIDIVIKQHSPEMNAWLSEQQIPIEKIPPHNPNCNQVFNKNNLKILFPEQGITYYLEKNTKAQLQLKATSGSEITEVLWYVNKKFISKNKISEPIFVNPPSGKVTIECTDSKGNSSKITVQIAYL